MRPARFDRWRITAIVAAALVATRLPGGRAVAAEAPRRVRVVASGPAPVIAAVEAVVRELLARQPAVLDWSTTPAIDVREILDRGRPRAEIAIRVWLDLSDSDHARIVVASGDSEHFVVRQLPLRNGYDEVAREAIGHIVESAAHAFLSGVDAGLTREAARAAVVRDREAAASEHARARDRAGASTPVAPSAGLAGAGEASSPASTTNATAGAAATAEAESGPATPSRPSSPSELAPAEAREHADVSAAADAGRSARPRGRARGPRVALAATYAARLLAPGPIVQQGPALALSLGLPARARIRFAAHAGAAYEAPLSWSATPVGARFEGVALEAGAGVEVDVGRRSAVRLLAVAAASREHVAPVAQLGTTATAAPAFWRTLPTAAAIVSADVRLAGRVGLLLAAGAEVDLAGARYDLVRGGVAAPALAPWRVRPVARVGLSVALSGP